TTPTSSAASRTSTRPKRTRPNQRALVAEGGTHLVGRGRVVGEDEVDAGAGLHETAGAPRTREAPVGRRLGVAARPVARPRGQRRHQLAGAGGVGCDPTVGKAAGRPAADGGEGVTAPAVGGVAGGRLVEVLLEHLGHVEVPEGAGADGRTAGCRGHVGEGGRRRTPCGGVAL